MTYEQTIDYLYNQLAMYQRVGASAYKPGLDTAIALDAMFGAPSKRLRCIHIAGTNGKGSTAHTLAAILQAAGYKTGLYTSPHLVDFRERIRVNGRMIAREKVVDFTDRWLAQDSSLHPSFFELTMTMAFEHFADEEVDFAVIETGLGGRLDSTNIITPVLSLITNISYDHTAMLGNTLPEIAGEKAGIIKPGIPAIVSEAEGDVKAVFEAKAKETGSPLTFACENIPFGDVEQCDDCIRYHNTPFGEVAGELTGNCQPHNAALIMLAVEELRRQGYEITDEAVKKGFAQVCELTGLAGRWMKLAERPLTICDTGHNIGGWEYIARQLASTPGHRHIIIGFANDKDTSEILRLISRIDNATVYAARASVPRALADDELAERAKAAGIQDVVTAGTVEEAYASAKAASAVDDTIFIGGSNFVVADLLAAMQK